MKTSQGGVAAGAIGLSLNELDDTQMVELLRSGEHAAALSVYFGQPLYRELRKLAVAAAQVQPTRARVYLLPGLMGSKLGYRSARRTQLRWLNPHSLANGELSTLALPARRPLQVLGAMLPTYLKLKLMLEAAGFDVRFYAYDWRLSIAKLGKALAETLSADPATQIMLVAHSMGGLVARAAMRHASGAKITRLVQLGTPNQGSFALVQALRAVYPTVRKLAALDSKHNAEDLAKRVFCSLPGLYEMLPAHTAGLDFFDARTWPAGGPRLNIKLLQRARAVSKQLVSADARCHLIAGVGQPTIVGVKRTPTGFSYQFSRAGDGAVPVSLAHWDGADCRYAPLMHGELVKNTAVCRAVIDLLNAGGTRRLVKHWRMAPGTKTTRSEAALRRTLQCKLHWEQLPPNERRTLLEPFISAELKALCRTQLRKKRKN